MMVAVGYNSAISTCIGVDVVDVLRVSEVSPSSQKQANSGSVARFIYVVSNVCQKNM